VALSAQKQIEPSLEKPRQKHLGQKNNSIRSYLFALDFFAVSGVARQTDFLSVNKRSLPTTLRRR
jgi:hypothetical protein